MELSKAAIDRIIEMAWEDRTTFEAIKRQFGMAESEVIELMRRHMQKSSFNRWRKRVSGRLTKHEKKMKSKIPNFEPTDRFKCSRQKSISNNKIAKR